MRRRAKERKDKLLSKSAARTMRDYAIINHTIRPHSEYPYDAAFPRKVDFFPGQELVNVGRLGGGNVRWRVVTIETRQGGAGVLTEKRVRVGIGTKLDDMLTIQLQVPGYSIRQFITIGQVIYSATWRIAPEYQPEENGTRPKKGRGGGLQRAEAAE